MNIANLQMRVKQEARRRGITLGALVAEHGLHPSTLRRAAKGDHSLAVNTVAQLLAMVGPEPVSLTVPTRDGRQVTLTFSIA